MADETLSSYFAQFFDFIPDPNARLQQEFDRLADFKGWKNKKYGREKQKCLLNEYDLYVGTIVHGSSSEKLGKLQGLCIELGVDPVPVSITACGKALRKVHVNIIDLLDARRRRTASTNTTLDAALQNLDLNPTATGSRQPVRVEVFKNVKQLQEYTRQMGRYFPKKKAKTEGALSCLLREIN